MASLAWPVAAIGDTAISTAMAVLRSSSSAHSTQKPQGNSSPYSHVRDGVNRRSRPALTSKSSQQDVYRFRGVQSRASRARSPRKVSTPLPPSEDGDQDQLKLNGIGWCAAGDRECR